MSGGTSRILKTKIIYGKLRAPLSPYVVGGSKGYIREGGGYVYTSLWNRSGAFSFGDGGYLSSSARRGSIAPADAYNGLGFRVASVPEPCSLVLMGLGVVMLRKRK